MEVQFCEKFQVAQLLAPYLFFDDEAHMLCRYAVKRIEWFSKSLIFLRLYLQLHPILAAPNLQLHPILAAPNFQLHPILAAPNCQLHPILAAPNFSCTQFQVHPIFSCTLSICIHMLKYLTFYSLMQLQLEANRTQKQLQLNS